MTRALLVQRLVWIGMFAAPAIGAGCIFLVVTSTLERADKGLAIFLLLSAIAGSVVACIYQIYFKTSDSHPSELALDLQRLLEEKRVRASELTLDVDFRRSSYKEEIPEVISKLRSESRFYRRIHNMLQGVVIVGSLVTTTVSSLSVADGQYRIFAVITSLAVGISAGFTGYFKFRERGFYLQQTADAIEQQWQSFELGIGRYGDSDKAKALAEFVAEVERLRAEQQQREQNLDQPSDKSAAPSTT